MAVKRPVVSARTLSTPRSAALSGVVFALIFAVSLVLIHTSLPEDLSAQPGWAAGNSSRLTLALTLMPFAGIAYLWFLGVVRDRMGDLEDRFFSSVYFGSGLLFLAMISSRWPWPQALSSRSTRTRALRNKLTSSHLVAR